MEDSNGYIHTYINNSFFFWLKFINNRYFHTLISLESLHNSILVWGHFVKLIYKIYATKKKLERILLENEAL